MTTHEVNPIDRLRSLVQQHGTQQRAADALGISRTYLCEILLGRRAVGPSVLAALGLRRTVVSDKRKVS